MDKTIWQFDLDFLKVATRIWKGGNLMRFDFNSVLLLVIAIELALIYVKMGKK
jgi:hypothetical protein